MSLPPTGTPLGIGPIGQESAPLRRKLVATLRRLIETGRLPAGQRLIEKDLCSELAVSRTVLREALRELEVDGLLVAGARGLSVAVLSRTEAENIYAVRASLEALVARQFCARADAAAVAALDATLDALHRAYEADALGTMLDAKLDFYRTLCAGAANPVARDLLDRLNARISLLRARSLADPARKHASLAEIEALVDALRRGDGVGAAALAERHVAEAARAALTIPPSDPLNAPETHQ
ncbi:GntR family transcriptional regulator [Ancylobacter defluvii]|uniref:GntR family transcriptional regulator n=1 Tax=Ancylobacter defluvii TaxID=1282440 RepID=A0A9W6JUE5_9HYPH|nr:GntR family transcriptional regulator [Ancylobacter defluvii]MBS7588661.1 GntR family transcriptional regulator [Ancylobacter defluvii]GLK83941.1 GntR family transcriptional regulator [Ancylobacter defluvii]